MDGLIYVQRENILHIVIYNDILDKDTLLLSERRLSLFQYFINQEKPLASNNNFVLRTKLRRWIEFFDEESGIINKKCVKLSLLLGFNEFHSKEIIYLAQEKGFILIGPIESFDEIK